MLTDQPLILQGRISLSQLLASADQPPRIMSIQPIPMFCALVVASAWRVQGNIHKLFIARFVRVLLAIGTFVLLASACTPAQRLYVPVDTPGQRTLIGTDEFRTRDGQTLELKRWEAKTDGRPHAVMVALHGMNDHKGRFDRGAQVWSNAGIEVLAYDQRGFGRKADGNLWPGREALVQDLIDFTVLVEEDEAYRGVPIALLGESMGGAVVLLAQAEPDLPKAVKRAVLVAPAVRGHRALGPFRSAALWLFAHTVPDLTISTEPEIRELSEDGRLTARLIKDEDFRKTIRLDATWGIVNLMDDAVEAAPEIREPVLVVYGGEDTLIPASAVRSAAETMRPELSEICYRPFSGHLLLHETLERKGARPQVSPQPLQRAVGEWVISGELPELCK